jgi:hypothetical protein
MNKIKKYSALITKALHNNGKNFHFVLILFRLMFWELKYKGGFSNFFMLNLHKRGSKFIQIIGNKEFRRIHDKLNPSYYRSLLEDKYIFDRFMKSYNFPLAQMRGIIMNNSIFWLNEKGTEPLEAIINYELDCYCKMLTKWGGQDVHKLEINDRNVTIDNKLSDIPGLKKMVSNAIFVLQTTICQHPEMNRINSSCVNTVRAITIHNGEYATNFINYLRLGVGNSIVDNISHGGLGCGIREDGTIFDTAMDKFGFTGWITHHPDSNVEFKGFKIPFYNEALKLVVNMHQCFHCFFIIGWDIAITESGPVIIEANPVGGLLYEQTLYGGFRQQFLKYANSYREKKGIK